MKRYYHTKGFIPLERDYVRWKYYQTRTGDLFLHLCLLTEYAAGSVGDVKTYPNQAVVTYEQLAYDLRRKWRGHSGRDKECSRFTIRRLMAKLIADGAVSIAHYHDYTIVTILKYLKFKGIKAPEVIPETPPHATSHATPHVKSHVQNDSQAVESENLTEAEAEESAPYPAPDSAHGCAPYTLLYKNNKQYKNIIIISACERTREEVLNLYFSEDRAAFLVREAEELKLGPAEYREVVELCLDSWLSGFFGKTEFRDEQDAIQCLFYSVRKMVKNKNRGAARQNRKNTLNDGTDRNDNQGANSNRPGGARGTGASPLHDEGATDFEEYIRAKLERGRLPTEFADGGGGDFGGAY